jgi:hypothetical protein
VLALQGAASIAALLITTEAMVGYSERLRVRLLRCGLRDASVAAAASKW